MHVYIYCLGRPSQLVPTGVGMYRQRDLPRALGTYRATLTGIYRHMRLAGSFTGRYQGARITTVTHDQGRYRKGTSHPELNELTRSARSRQLTSPLLCIT